MLRQREGEPLTIQGRWSAHPPPSPMTLHASLINPPPAAENAQSLPPCRLSHWGCAFRRQKRNMSSGDQISFIAPISGLRQAATVPSSPENSVGYHRMPKVFMPL